MQAKKKAQLEKGERRRTHLYPLLRLQRVILFHDLYSSAHAICLASAVRPVASPIFFHFLFMVVQLGCSSNNYLLQMKVSWTCFYSFVSNFNMPTLVASCRTADCRAACPHCVPWRWRSARTRLPQPEALHSPWRRPTAAVIRKWST